MAKPRNTVFEDTRALVLADRLYCARPRHTWIAHRTAIAVAEKLPRIVGSLPKATLRHLDG